MKAIYLLMALSLSLASGSALAGANCPHKAQPDLQAQTNGQSLAVAKTDTFKEIDIEALSKIK